MRQKMFAIGDDFWIENDRGEKVYKVDGKALRLRSTLILEDRNGREVAKIQERMLRVKDSMEIEDANGKQVGMVKKALITPIRERWVVKIKDGPDLARARQHPRPRVQNRRRPRQGGRSFEEMVPSARHLWRRDRRGQDDAVILAITIAIDEMAHPSR